MLADINAAVRCKPLSQTLGLQASCLPNPAHGPLNLLTALTARGSAGRRVQWRNQAHDDPLLRPPARGAADCHYAPSCKPLTCTGVQIQHLAVGPYMQVLKELWQPGALLANRCGGPVSVLQTRLPNPFTGSAPGRHDRWPHQPSAAHGIQDAPAGTHLLSIALWTRSTTPLGLARDPACRRVRSPH